MRAITWESYYRNTVRRLIRDGKAIRLLYGHRVYLMALGGDLKRFASLFRKTWKRVPYGVRRAILRHWRDHCLFSCMRVELSNLWADTAIAIAQVGQAGCELKFNADSMDAMPRSAVLANIAHELAHVYQRTRGIVPVRVSANGDATYADKEGKVWGDTVAHEADADRLAESWGFDRTTLIMWKLMNTGRKDSRDTDAIK